MQVMSFNFICSSYLMKLSQSLTVSNKNKTPVITQVYQCMSKTTKYLMQLIYLIAEKPSNSCYRKHALPISLNYLVLNRF